MDESFFNALLDSPLFKRDQWPLLPFCTVNSDPFAIATFIMDGEDGAEVGAVDVVCTRDTLDQVESLFSSQARGMELGRYPKRAILIIDRAGGPPMTVLFARNCNETELRQIAELYNYNLPYPISEAFREKFFDE